MANPRTTDALVKEVLEVRNAIKVMPFIRIANTLVTDYIVTECEASYSATKLEQIETQLAAHLYSVRDRRLGQEQTGRASGQYQGKTEMGLDSTLYGQTAMLLDTDGCLAKLNNAPGKRKIGASWAGTKPSVRVDDFWK